jgi:polyisoprenoid-binding protein YceI
MSPARAVASAAPAVLAGLGLVAAALHAQPAGAQPVIYRLDLQRTWVQFEVLHFGTSTTRGRFGPIEGEVVLDATAGTGEIALRVPTATVNTGIPVFDARLRRDDLLDSAGWPEAYFVARRVRFDGAALAEVSGEFTLRGIGQPLTLRAVRYGCRDDVDRQARVCGGDFEGEIRRSDFGATFGLPFVSDRVRLLVQVEGAAQRP